MWFSQSSLLEYQLSPFPIHFPASSFWQHTTLNLLMHSVPLEWQRPHNRRKTHLWRHSHMQLFIESENYRTASGNSKLTSLPVSFLYTEAKVSVLCSMLVCWVLSRCTLNRREPSRRILKIRFQFHSEPHLAYLCFCVCIKWTWSSCQQSRRGRRGRRGWPCAQPAGFATWPNRGLSWNIFANIILYKCTPISLL